MCWTLASKCLLQTKGALLRQMEEFSHRHLQVVCVPVGDANHVSFVKYISNSFLSDIVRSQWFTSADKMFMKISSSAGCRSRLLSLKLCIPSEASIFSV